MAEWAHYSLPNAEWTQALDAIGGSLYKSNLVYDIPSRREAFNGYSQKEIEAGGEETLNGITVEETRIPVTKPEGDILIRIYTPVPNTEKETFPVLVNIHGGGYCLGNLDTDEIKCRSACQKHRIVVVNIDYRLAPEFPWPTGINDSYDAVKWVSQHAPEIRANLTKGFIVNGLSAGGTLACVVAQRARTDPDLQGKLTGQILQIPKTCKQAPEGYPERFRNKLLSYEQNKTDPVLTRETLEIFYKSYKAGPQTHLEVSPLLAETFSGLPAAYIQVAGADPLRDDGLCYAEQLEKAKVSVKLDVYPGVPHGFASVFPQLKISQKWRDDFDEGVQWLLKNVPQIIASD